MPDPKQHAQPGDTVRVHYTGTLGDGTKFDSSAGRDPLEFTLGAGQVVPGFDSAVTGMRLGEKKTVTIPAADAYGEPRQDLLLTVPRAQVPPNMQPRVGQRLQVGRGENAFPVVVHEVTDEHVILDGNHPLAGKDLTFALELVGIE
jgi:peptidylprolyl isomerase